ncbi:MAG: S1C family serine protease [Oscillospiraceae bacterium]|nr:S1C family serine protease [Oscillospiraceae bacterium]
MNDKSGWYEPFDRAGQAESAVNAVPAAGGQTAVTAGRKTSSKSRGIWMVILIVLLVAALIVLSSIIFRKISGSKIDLTIDNNGDVSSFSFGGSDDGFGILPFDVPDSGSETPADEFPESKDDFFSSFFTPAESYDVNIGADTYEGKLDQRLELSENGTKLLTLQELYAKCSPSVVTIITYQNKLTEFGMGTGIIISSDGLIMTNTHVIDDCDRITVKLSNDDLYEALLVGADASSDIAILKIDASSLPVAEFGSSDTLQVGEEVAAIGNPLSESFRSTLTNGIISGIDRGVNYNGRTMTVLQTNTALNNGNSGGPLYNMYGKVIGVTNMKMASSVYSSVEGIGFAIPSNNAISIANALIANGEVRGRTSIGITVGAVPDNAAEQYKIPFGLYVTDVTAGSDAEAKGILPGDIITHVNGKEVRTTQDILDAKEGLLVGDSMIFTIYRDDTGKTFDVEVVLMDTLDVYG